jgi:hypothetical protein
MSKLDKEFKINTLKANKKMKGKKVEINIFKKVIK